MYSARTLALSNYFGPRCETWRRPHWHCLGFLSSTGVSGAGINMKNLQTYYPHPAGRFSLVIILYSYLLQQLTTNMRFTTVSSFLTLFIALCSGMFLTNALPVIPGTREVWAPPILYPNHNITWRVGEKHNVTWSVYTPLLLSRIQYL